MSGTKGTPAQAAPKSATGSARLLSSSTATCFAPEAWISAAARPAAATVMAEDYRRLLLRVTVIVFLTTAVASVIFQSTTFALPKIFDERLGGLAQQLAAWVGGAESEGLSTGGLATMIGSLTFFAFAVASIARSGRRAIPPARGGRPR